MTRLVIVAIGGAIGTAARYWLSGVVQNSAQTFFPTGTLAVNVLGCLVIGFLGGLAARPEGLGINTRLFLMVGICGGFTTFSAFGFETLQLLTEGETWQAGLNITAQLVGGLGATWAGLALAKLI
jgi:CrcB protein